LQVPVGIVSVVVGTPRDKAASLLALGIYPGVTVELRQKYPCPIVKCDETEVAFDEAIARGIMVRPA
jgi:Fe2+ transport system protein FeoA